MADRPMEFWESFGEQRLEAAIRSIAGASPSLSIRVRHAAGAGSLIGRMQRCARELRDVASQLFLPGEEELEQVRTELKAVLGPHFSRPNVTGLLMGHATGLAQMASIEGIGQAIFLHYSGIFARHLASFLRENRVDEETAREALSLVRRKVQETLSKSSPDDRNPVMVIARSAGPSEAAAYVGVRLSEHRGKKSTLTLADQLIFDFFYPVGPDGERRQLSLDELEPG
ncbi:MAG: hypothetical protein U0R44_02490 [Candidatus Micrarchaeia archaeon]